MNAAIRRKPSRRFGSVHLSIERQSSGSHPNLRLRVGSSGTIRWAARGQLWESEMTEHMKQKADLGVSLTKTAIQRSVEVRLGLERMVVVPSWGAGCNVTYRIG